MRVPLPGRWVLRLDWKIILMAFVVLGLTGAAGAQTNQPVYSIPLGIALEEIAYPYPVPLIPSFLLC
jgi:hypothetical protein